MPHPTVSVINEDNIGILLGRLGVTATPEPPPPAANGNHSSYGEFDLQGFISRNLEVHREVADGKGTKYILSACPFNPEHKAPDAAIFRLASGAIAFRCLHNSCSQYKWQDVRAKFEPRQERPIAQSEQKVLAQPAKAREPLAPFETMSCGELEATPDEEFLCRGVIVARQPNMIGGPPKAFKTTIAVDLALSLATAGHFLGYFKCPKPVSVLFMSAESGLSTLRKTAQSICEQAGIAWPNVPNLRWSTFLPKFGVDEELARLDLTFAANPFDVLIVDPLYKAMPSADAGNVFAAGELFAHFGRWSDANNVTLILLHHLKKGVADPYQPAELQDFAWSGFAEHARSWLLLSRREKYLHPAPHKLWMSVGGSAGHSGCWGIDIDQGEFVEGQPRDWNIQLTAAAELLQEEAKAKQEAKNEAKLTTAQAKAAANVKTLLSTLQGYPDGETRTVIRTRCGLNSNALNIAIADALEAKAIEPCDVFKSGKKTPIAGYRITKPIPTGTTGTNHQDN